MIIMDEYTQNNEYNVSSSSPFLVSILFIISFLLPILYKRNNIDILILFIAIICIATSIGILIDIIIDQRSRGVNGEGKDNNDNNNTNTDEDYRDMPYDEIAGAWIFVLSTIALISLSVPSLNKGKGKYHHADHQSENENGERRWGNVGEKVRV